MIVNLQSFLREFVTKPEASDNRFITQHVFYNINIVKGGRGRKKFLVPRTYGWQKDLQFNIDMLFNMHNFISYDEFYNMFYEKRDGKTPAESSYLRFRHDILSNFGPIDKKKKIHPQLKTKSWQIGFFNPLQNFLAKQKRGQKTTGKFSLKIRS